MPENEKKCTLRLERTTHKKSQYIAKHYCLSLNSFITVLLKESIDQFERSRGEITLPQK